MATDLASFSTIFGLSVNLLSLSLGIEILTLPCADALICKDCDSKALLDALMAPDKVNAINSTCNPDNLMTNSRRELGYIR